MRIQRRIQSTMAAFIENGMDDEVAPLLVSRLEWWNQINRYLNMLKNTPESIDSVASGIEVLINNHQLHRSEVEEDLVDAIFSRALKNGSISHLYATVEAIEERRKERLDTKHRPSLVPTRRRAIQPAA